MAGFAYKSSIKCVKTYHLPFLNRCMLSMPTWRLPNRKAPNLYPWRGTRRMSYGHNYVHCWHLCIVDCCGYNNDKSALTCWSFMFLHHAAECAAWILTPLWWDFKIHCQLEADWHLHGEILVFLCFSLIYSFCFPKVQIRSTHNKDKDLKEEQCKC